MGARGGWGGRRVGLPSAMGCAPQTWLTPWEPCSPLIHPGVPPSNEVCLRAALVQRQAQAWGLLYRLHGVCVPLWWAATVA